MAALTADGVDDLVTAVMSNVTTNVASTSTTSVASTSTNSVASSSTISLATASVPRTSLSNTSQTDGEMTKKSRGKPPLPQEVIESRAIAAADKKRNREMLAAEVKSAKTAARSANK
jgi:hypothetical protein